MLNVNLKIEQRWIGIHRYKPPCNDCNKPSLKHIKFPKLKEISVCMDCYNEHYKWQIERSFRELYNKGNNKNIL